LDEFVEFNYLLLNASPDVGRPAGNAERCTERVDVIARQFRDFLKRQTVAGERPSGVMMTHDFRVRGQASRAAGWLSFYVDRGDGSGEALEEVAIVAFARERDGEVRGVLERVMPGAPRVTLPAAPLAVGVLLAAKVPRIVVEFMPKVAAGFFSREF
jgi:hypothetical protein